MTAVSRWPPVRSDWNLPGILPGTRGCAFSRFDDNYNRMSGSQVTAILLLFPVLERCIYRSWSVVPPYHALSLIVTSRMMSQLMFIYFFARLTSQFFFFFVWYDVTIDAGDLSMCLLKVWYRSSSSVSAVSQVMAIYLPNQWQDTVLWRHNSSSLFDMTSQLTLGTWVCAFSRFDIVLLHPF